MDRTRWIIFIGACVVMLGGLIFFSSKDKVDTSNTDPATIVTTGDIPDHVYGNKESKVVLIEYGDYQCPGCGAAAPQVKAIADEYKQDIAFVFRNFPITSIHPNALAAAAVAEAAGQQGKFWEMHDLLYQTHSVWSNYSIDERSKSFEGYAKQIGLDIEQYKTDAGSKKVSNKISLDKSLGAKAGVESTPSFFLNGTEVDKDTVSDVMSGKGDKLRQKIDEALKK